MPFLTPPEELREQALALERARNSATLSVKYADKAITYRSMSDIDQALQRIYEQLRAAGELPALEEGSKQIRPVNDSGW